MLYTLIRIPLLFLNFTWFLKIFFKFIKNKIFLPLDISLAPIKNAREPEKDMLISNKTSVRKGAMDFIFLFFFFDDSFDLIITKKKKAGLNVVNIEL